MRKAGVLCQRAMEAMVARAKRVCPNMSFVPPPAAILDGEGDIDFLIIGSTPMDNPAMVFGNPRPPSASSRMTSSTWSLPPGTTGSPLRSAPRSRSATDRDGAQVLGGSRSRATTRSSPRSGRVTRPTICGSRAGFRDKGAVAPHQVHGIDIVTDKPHVFAERTEADELDKILKPGMIIMAEPNPITADGMFGIFLGHTFIVTAGGHECVDKLPLEIAVARW